MKRLIHAITDLALAFCFGGGIVAAVSATMIFRESAARGYERAHANVLAGEMFANVGGPLLIAACLVGAGCIYSALKPPLNELPGQMKVNAWRAMAIAGLLITLSVGYMEGIGNRRMHELRREAKWEGAKLASADEQAEFDGLHKQAAAIYSFMILSSGALLFGRRALG
ncbi:hypothetical protein ANRL4_01811 [Anaerolineae bacterium]|nr:hypothetical protein ANRL4_01811 [Anaerolineae bacterium]